MLHAQIYAQSAPMTEQQLLIAGGGIGGLGMALACAQAFEREEVYFSVLSSIRAMVEEE